MNTIEIVLLTIAAATAFPFLVCFYILGLCILISPRDFLGLCA